LHTFYTATLDFIICGDININYLINSDRKNHLHTLLLSDNLSGIINVPTGVQKNPVTATDNISRMGKYTIIPVFTGLFNHDAQLLTVSTTNCQIQSHQRKIVRKPNKHKIHGFLTNLSYET
jgi:hypothetical protein